MRRVSGVFALIVVATGVAGCTPPLNLSGGPLKATTTGEAFGGVQCSAARPQSEPDLMAWDPGSRAKLNRLRLGGIVAVRYEAKGCDAELELLSNCIGKGAYSFSPYSANEHKVAHNASELFAQLPIGAARFSGKLNGDRALRTDYMLAGQYALPPGVSFGIRDLHGQDCARATHVVSTVYVGAFAMGAGESRAMEGGASLLGSTATGSSTANIELLADEGNAEACSKSQKEGTEDARCAVPLRIGLLALDSSSVDRSDASDPVVRDASSPSPQDALESGTSSTTGNTSKADIHGNSMLASAQRQQQESMCPASPPACAEAAKLFRNAGDYATAAELARKGYVAGSSIATAELAEYYFQGIGVKEDKPKAFSLYQSACEAGAIAACTMLATLYENGVATPIDKVEAEKWRRKACAAGDLMSCARPTAIVGSCSNAKESSCTEYPGQTNLLGVRSICNMSDGGTWADAPCDRKKIEFGCSSDSMTKWWSSPHRMSEGSKLCIGATILKPDGTISAAHPAKAPVRRFFGSCELRDGNLQLSTCSEHSSGDVAIVRKICAASTGKWSTAPCDRSKATLGCLGASSIAWYYGNVSSAQASSLCQRNSVVSP